MFGETYSVLTDEIADGAGELANIIFGTAKTILTDSGFSLEKALPTIIRGSDIKLTSLSRGGPMIVVPFQGTDGLFHILISLSRNGKEEVKQPFSQARP